MPARLFTFACAAAIVVISLLPPGSTPDAGWDDKVGHFLAYAVTAAAASQGFRRPLLALLLLAALGGGLEFVQDLIGRNADLRDWAADILGAAAGLTAGTLLGGLRRRA